MRSSCSTSNSGTTKSLMSPPSAAAASCLATWRHVDRSRWPSGKCCISVRTSASVFSVMMWGITICSDAASVATNPHAYATPTAFYERKTSNPTYTSVYASRMKLISLMHGTGGRRVSALEIARQKPYAQFANRLLAHLRKEECDVDMSNLQIRRRGDRVRVLLTERHSVVQSTASFRFLTTRCSTCPPSWMQIRANGRPH